MKKFLFCLTLFLSISGQKSFSQLCPMEIGFHYNIFVFSANGDLTFKELFGVEINPILVNVIQVKDATAKENIDNQCLTGKLETCIFIYPSKDKNKIFRFCNQHEYATALKSNLKLVIE